MNSNLLLQGNHDVCVLQGKNIVINYSSTCVKGTTNVYLPHFECCAQTQGIILVTLFVNHIMTILCNAAFLLQKIFARVNIISFFSLFNF